MMTVATLMPEERYARETQYDAEGPLTGGYGQEQRHVQI
jgi:hypothetical protein